MNDELKEDIVSHVKREALAGKTIPMLYLRSVWEFLGSDEDIIEKYMLKISEFDNYDSYDSYDGDARKLLFDMAKTFGDGHSQRSMNWLVLETISEKNITLAVRYKTEGKW